jgi:hypothetical protein
VVLYEFFRYCTVSLCTVQLFNKNYANTRENLNPKHKRRRRKLYQWRRRRRLA